MHTHYAQPIPHPPCRRRWPETSLPASVSLCAVDLRDGNQALPIPLRPEQKLRYFRLLTDSGFKEIEIGFPASSMDEWEFCRNLIDQGLIPQETSISVLTQARDHVIRRTFEALKGVRDAICHIYIPTSDLHVNYVLGVSREQLKSRLFDSIILMRQLADSMTDSHIRLEFSPEEFTDSDLEFVTELCDGVVQCWQPRADEKVIINLPCTVERALPTHYADMLEAFREKSSQMEHIILSIHPHNDMGTAVASAELGLLAGATRVEGTLFGNGERAGNLDLITLAMNLQYFGVETGLQFPNLEAISAEVSNLTSMPIHPRQPYAGSLAFTAFAGSHQDAIHKGLDNAERLNQHFHGWKIPYLHINPADIGRNFQKDIRITSQSGKGGIAYVIENSYGVQLPQELLVQLTDIVKQETVRTGFELTPDRIWDIFLEEYYRQNAPLRLVNYWPRPDTENPDRITAEVHVTFNGKSHVLTHEGNGPVAAFAEALRLLQLPQFQLIKYEERSIGITVNAESITIVSLRRLSDNRIFYGVGFGANIVQGAARAIISGLNRMM